MTNNRLSCSCSQNSPGLPWVWNENTDEAEHYSHLKHALTIHLHSPNKPRYFSEGLSWAWTPPLCALTRWTASALTSALQSDPEFIESSDQSLQSQVWHEWIDVGTILDQFSIKWIKSNQRSEVTNRHALPSKHSQLLHETHLKRSSLHCVIAVALKGKLLNISI